MPAPGADCALGLINSVKEGKIDESVLDERLFELLGVVNSTHDAVSKSKKDFDKLAHHALARRCAEESIVLLENDGILPLSPNASVTIIGDFANSPRYQGAGSSQVNPTQIDNLFDCASAAGLNITGYATGYDRANPNPDLKMIQGALDVAKDADVVLLCVGLEEIIESEGMDRLHMDLSKSQQKLIEEICAINKNVILVLSGGAPFVMPKASYRAAIHGYLGGQAGAGAMVDALIGKINPSGKLSETWPIALSDTPCANYFPSKERTAEYREGLYVGYRYYDSANVPVRYPFGYGLSYTKFEYSDIEINGNDVSFTLKNIGERDGAEVAQLYVSCQNGVVYRPKKELKGFSKVFLKAGESKKVSIKLDDKAFRYFDTESHSWQVEDADYDIIIASSVSDVKLCATLHVDGTKPTAPSPLCYKNADIKNVSDEDFKVLLGREIPNGAFGGELTANDAFCQLYYAESLIARLIYKVLTSIKNKAEAKGKPNLNIMFIYNMPFRAIAKMSNGLVSEKMVDDIVFIFNGHLLRGLGRLIVDFFKNLNHSSKFNKLLKN
jgi:beta-glucosidase